MASNTKENLAEAILEIEAALYKVETTISSLRRGQGWVDKKLIQAAHDLEHAADNIEEAAERIV